MPGGSGVPTNLAFLPMALPGVQLDPSLVKVNTEEDGEALRPEGTLGSGCED